MTAFERLVEEFRQPTRGHRIVLEREIVLGVIEEHRAMVRTAGALIDAISALQSLATTLKKE